MKKRIIVFIVVFLALVSICLFVIDDNNELKDNYYLTINEDIFKEKKLSDNEYSWSYFLEAQEEVDNNISLIVENILNDSNSILTEKEVKIIDSIYNKALDINKRNKDGIKDLEPYLNKVWTISTVDELINVIILVENDLGVDLLTNVEVISDYKDNKKNIIYFYPITYAFGSSSDYMVNEDYMTYKAYIRRACVQLWKAYGYEAKEAREVVERVFTFYEDVSRNSKLSNELEDIVDYYNLVSEDDINDLFSGVDSDYLTRRGLDGKEVYSLVDREQYKYLNDSLTMDNLGIWREVIITKILSSYASYGSNEYVEVINNLNESLLGNREEFTYEDMAEEMVINLFGDEIDKTYESTYLDEDCVLEIEKMFLEIKAVYKKRLKNNSWLSDEAKEKALVKLDKMNIIVGMGDVNGYDIASKLVISNNSLISDVIRINQLIMADELDRLSSGEDRNLVLQTQVNAYYQPLDNSIIIPVAFFELVDEKTSYYEKLGTLGMILAHEVTHAFDGNGSMFDEFGNLNNWWSDADKNNFEELIKVVSKYYSKYEVIDGKYINGEKTVNENIADLGAVACIVDIANDKGASDEEFRLMFSSLANMWASIESEEYMELLLLQDVHSPNQFRVNAVLSSTYEFYRVYNIYPWNDMWIDKNDRVIVW